MRDYYHGSATNLKTILTLLGSDPSATIRFKAMDLLQVGTRVHIIRERESFGGYEIISRRNDFI